MVKWIQAQIILLSLILLGSAGLGRAQTRVDNPARPETPGNFNSPGAIRDAVKIND